ncbi:isoamyl acetate-hydrolyzing esterase, partial [Coemansia sp. RSA 2708]
MYDTLLAFGDSITQFGSNPGISGFVTHLSGYYSRRMDVLNRGFSGYNTRDALRIADRVFPKTRTPHQLVAGWPWHDFTFPETPKVPKLCLVFFGANDARLPPYSQHVPLEEFYGNLRRLAFLLRDPSSKHYSPETRIMFITPPAIGDRMIEAIARRNGHQPDRKNAVTKLYANAVKEVAAEMDMPVVDIWSAIEGLVHDSTTPGLPGDKLQDDKVGFVENHDAEAARYLPEKTKVSPFEGYEKYLSDGLHLNSGGNELLFKLIVSKIKEAWPELDPAAITEEPYAF